MPLDVTAGPTAPPVGLTLVHSDERGSWYAVGTKRGWIEFRVTPTGLVRVGPWRSGKHPYFTPGEEDERGVRDDDADER